jgi:GrpB-like predicted nucleotidyltransferase (UPF0157 family)
MPEPFAVELFAHDRAWADAAAAEGERLRGVLGGTLLAVHHIGSTAIPGIAAKPLLDLMPVVTSLAALDGLSAAVAALGYRAWGEYRLPGRRYFTRSDPASGRRLVQVHAYADGDPAIARHLAFRDYLRAHPAIARAYGCEKQRCRDLHPADSHAYSACKSAWIRMVEAEALAWVRSGG